MCHSCTFTPSFPTPGATVLVVSPSPVPGDIVPLVPSAPAALQPHNPLMLWPQNLERTKKKKKRCLSGHTKPCCGQGVGLACVPSMDPSLFGNIGVSGVVACRATWSMAGLLGRICLRNQCRSQ